MTSYRFDFCRQVAITLPVFSLLATAIAHAEPPVAVTPRTGDAPAMSLKTEAVFPAGVAKAVVVPDTKITLETRSLPLPQVLSAVQKQSGVTLSITPGTFAREPKVTMAVTQMPLREWMNALGNLYDVRWVANGPGSFEVRSTGRDALASALRTIGMVYDYNGEWYLAGGMPNYLASRPTFPWKQTVDENLDIAALNNQGVEWKDVPPDLQKAVREAVKRRIARDVLGQYRQLDGATGPLTITFAKRPGGLTVTNGYNGKSKFTPYPVEATIIDHNGMAVTKLDMVPSARGRDLLVDPHAGLRQMAAAPQMPAPRMPAPRMPAPRMPAPQPPQ